MRTPKTAAAHAATEAAPDATSKPAGGKARARSAQFALQRGIGPTLPAPTAAEPAAPQAPARKVVTGTATPSSRPGKKR